MFFSLSKILWFLVTPGTVLFGLLLATLALLARGYRRAATGILVFICAFWGLVMFTPFDSWIGQPIENRFPVPAPPRCLAGIIVLGGGEGTRLAGENRFVLAGAPMRYVILADLMRRYPDARVVFTGGSGALFPTGASESDAARALMTRLGLDTARASFDSKARNTWENAANVTDLMQVRPGEVWVLLARAIQMPRAIGAFRRLGWEPLAWPTDYQVDAAHWLSYDPTHRIEVLGLVEHEWLGLIAYRLTGKTSELLPAPPSAAASAASAACRS